MRHPAPGTPRSSPRVLYLTLYNSLLFSLWSSVLITVLFRRRNSKTEIFDATPPRTRWIQSLSFIEVLHATVGIVKSPVSTTFIQNFTRVVQVWLWYFFPAATGESYAFVALVLAWSAADMVRYLYLALHLHGAAPRWLVWLRYSMFVPLYPVGIGSEWWLMYLCIEPLGRISVVGPWVFWGLLVLYVPGAYTMFNHMVRQRRKMLGGSTKVA